MHRRHIQSHTALRGIAALLVVLYHLQYGSKFHFAWEQSTPFFIKGYLWVDLFFILSGFVIAYSTQAETRSTFPWQDVKRFWRARFARIYPLHLFCLLLMAGIQTSTLCLSSIAGKNYGDPYLWRGDSLLNFVEQLFLMNAWGLTGRIGWNIPSWSISAEAFGYLLFPAVAVFLARGGKYCVATLLAGSAAFYAYVALTTGNLDIVKGLAIARCLAGFYLGMILYWQRSAFDHLSTGILGLLQLVGLMIISAPLIAGLNDTIAIPGFFLLVAATWPDRGALPRVLAQPLFQWLGNISYSVYLTHVVLLEPWRLIVPPVVKRLDLGDPVARAILIGGGIPMILFASTLTYIFIEQPARATLNRKFAR